MFRSLRTRNYRLWFVGQTISQCGTWMQSVAQYWLVLELTHSAFDLGITAALQFAPVLLFGTIGGLVADRFDKRKVLLLTQTAFTVQAALLWVLVASGSVQLWMVWALALAYGFINVADNPSRQSFVVEMAGPDDLTNAVGLNSVIVNVSRIIGPAVAGVMIATVGLSWAFLANALSFAAVIAALYAMRASELHRRPPLGRAKGQIRAGLHYAWQAWELRVPLIMMAVIGTLAYNFSVVLPLFAHDVFHRGAGTYSALTVAMGIGALAGGLTIASRQRPSHRLLVVVSSRLRCAHPRRGGGADPAALPGPARGDGRRQHHVHRHRQLAAAVELKRHHAGARDGPVGGRLPGLDAHRRAADRLSCRALRRARRLGGGRRCDRAGRGLGGL